MIAKITRGAKMSGLLTYLQGEGKANEHTDPHLVAGDPAIMAWHDDNEMSRVDALDIAKQLDQPRRVFGTEVMIPNYLRDSDGRQRRARDVRLARQEGSRSDRSVSGRKRVALLAVAEGIRG